MIAAGRVRYGARFFVNAVQPIVQQGVDVQTRASGRGLIVHADDFGETIEITRGICEAIDAGSVTSTSVMASMPGTQYALDCMKHFASRASFGVHLNLCEGPPMTSGRSLRNSSGNFHAKRELFLRSIRGALDPDELEAEIDRQVATVASAGVPISHIDGHKHLHQLPGVAEAVARVAVRHGMERVRLTVGRSAGSWLRPNTAVREMLGLRAGRIFDRAHLRSPRRVVDLQVFIPATPTEKPSLDVLHAPGVVEIFCHPGSALADAEKPSSLRRHAELTFLKSPAFSDMVRESDRRLISYWEI